MSATMKIPSCLGNRYKLRRKIGAGTFGFVFEADDLQNGETVAVKLSVANKIAISLLQHEARISAMFGGKVGEPEHGFPRFHGCGNASDLSYMVMQRLGPNLDLLLKYNRKGFSLKTVLLLGSQMLARIERFHRKGFLHRDIKPHNFTMGWGSDGHCLYLIDFGLTARFTNSRMEHIPFAMGKGLIGTPWFCSVNAHDGCELSRRDDLESLFYVMIYLLLGSLPWQSVHNKEVAQWSHTIRQLKANTPDILRDLPPEFTAFYHQVRGLDFTQKPEYSALRSLLAQVFGRHEFANDLRYDWLVAAPALLNTSGLSSLGRPPVPLQSDRGKAHAGSASEPWTPRGGSGATGSFMTISEASAQSNAANMRSSILKRPFGFSGSIRSITRSVSSASNLSFASAESEEEDAQKKRALPSRGSRMKRHPRLQVIGAAAREEELHAQDLLAESVESRDSPRSPTNPASGSDQEQRRAMRKLLKMHKERGGGRPPPGKPSFDSI